MTDHAAAAHKAAEERLEACTQALDAECEGADSEDLWPEDMAGPFCGCLTCEVREALDAAFPHLLALAREEVRAAGQAEKAEMGTGVDTVSLFELDELADWRKAYES